MRKIVSIIYAAALPVAVVLPVATALTITVPNAASSWERHPWERHRRAHTEPRWHGKLPWQNESNIVDYACYKNLRRQGHSVDSASDNCKRVVPVN